MNPLRIVNIVILVLSLGVATFFAYQYFVKDQEVQQYKLLSKTTERAFRAASEKLDVTRSELEDTKVQLVAAKADMEKLNMTIAALEKDKLKFKDEIAQLMQQRDKLSAKVDSLEQLNLVLEEKFHSLDELGKAIKLVRLEKRVKERLAKMEMVKRLDELASRYGNRGFFVKNGETTFIKYARIKVELEPVTKLSLQLDPATKVSLNIESEK